MLLTRLPLNILCIATQYTPFDLHVLSTPPAFVLSQDQTLQISFLELNALHGYSVFKDLRFRAGSRPAPQHNLNTVFTCCQFGILVFLIVATTFFPLPHRLVLERGPPHPGLRPGLKECGVHVGSQQDVILV